MNKARLEAFSDGVFAIIITIMVLELKVPHGASWADLAHLWPVALSYVLSFVFVGIYWGNHHHLVHTVRRVTPGIIWANLALLFSLSLIPFGTAFMGEHSFGGDTVKFYAALLLFCGVCFTILQLSISASDPEQAQRLEHGFRQLKQKGIISTVLYTLAFGLAFYNSVLPGILFVVVAIMWLIPDRALERAILEHADRRDVTPPAIH